MKFLLVDKWCLNEPFEENVLTHSLYSRRDMSTLSTASTDHFLSTHQQSTPWKGELHLHPTLEPPKLLAKVHSENMVDST